MSTNPKIYISYIIDINEDNLTFWKKSKKKVNGNDHYDILKNKKELKLLKEKLIKKLQE